MSIIENMQMGVYPHINTDAIKADIDRMHDFFLRLNERATQCTGTPSGGEQQMTARSIISKPKLLLLDRPSMDLSPITINQNVRLARQAANCDYRWTQVW
jgi:branched-chain amino acid transport system ATP-binding protein